MLIYNIIIDNYFMAFKMLHDLVEIRPLIYHRSNIPPIDVLKWKIYDPIIYLKTKKVAFVHIRMTNTIAISHDTHVV